VALRRQDFPRVLIAFREESTTCGVIIELNEINDLQSVMCNMNAASLMCFGFSRLPPRNATLHGRRLACCQLPTHQWRVAGSSLLFTKSDQSQDARLRGPRCAHIRNRPQTAKAPVPIRAALLNCFSPSVTPGPFPWPDFVAKTGIHAWAVSSATRPTLPSPRENLASARCVRMNCETGKLRAQRGFLTWK
jgi:hypothetical protein